MPSIIRPNQGLIFMKVGVHAKEPLESIIKRKQQEFKNTGMIFWGYGGNTCHPIHVQPFAQEIANSGNDILLVMEEIESNHFAEQFRAEQYSDDGLNWQTVPQDINVLGSRFAMVLDELEFNEFDIDLEAMRVAVGPSRGRTATEYIKGRVDKGCFQLDPVNIARPTPNFRHIRLHAKLKDPYAVYLK